MYNNKNGPVAIKVAKNTHLKTSFLPKENTNQTNISPSPHKGRNEKAAEAPCNTNWFVQIIFKKEKKRTMIYKGTNK